MSAKTQIKSDIARSNQFVWLSTVERAIFVRATIVAVILGSVLTLINQPGWIAGTEPLQVLQLILVFALPFGVITTAQIAGAYQAQRDSAGHSSLTPPEPFLATLTSHGIPARAVLISLVFGSLNAISVIANVLVNAGDFATVSVVSLMQAFILPLLFGLMSQAITYRRERQKVSVG